MNDKIVVIDGAKKEQLEKSLRDKLQDTSDKDGDTELHLTPNEFEAKMLKEDDGKSLLDLIKLGEHRVMERMGLSNAYVDEGVAYIDVPSWGNMLGHLRIVNSI